MPIYEYQCRSCGSRIEVIQRVRDAPLRKCRECSGRLEKLISRTSFQLKGGGWYSQGYSGPTGKSGGAKGSKSETKSDAKSDTSDTKKKDRGGSSMAATVTA